MVIRRREERATLSHSHIRFEGTATPPDPPTKESDKFLSLPGALWIAKLRLMLQHLDSADRITWIKASELWNISGSDVHAVGLVAGVADAGAPSVFFSLPNPPAGIQALLNAAFAPTWGLIVRNVKANRPLFSFPCGRRCYVAAGLLPCSAFFAHVARLHARRRALNAARTHPLESTTGFSALAASACECDSGAR